MQQSFKQAAAVDLGGGELGFQLISHRHDSNEFGDDAV
jgi:hypothetical protein